ncbi:class I adenylate-forming enzyme family protein [Streptacidiphilus sp. P02-A3a]|uniref:class I adenylate-forming enzyme family protein n=1 Tax=Streptacidiphilus sp. P02-A3a TaxID=2704468 RepID=UPI0015FA533D|nr:fatty acid--CoA ligase family protein [Streptacidiphilus sp. P02-A3a]QMU71326.1 long-chain fatty acid--CoA ligase [Streptacidiphilus sp. P02-A3a]
MNRTWASNAGLVLRDAVPAELRARWAAAGLCPGRGLYQAFRDRVAAHPDRTAVTDAEGSLSYAELDARARSLAAALVRDGTGPGDLVGIQLPNSWRALAADLAVAAVGAVALPWPLGRGSQDARALLGRSRARALIAESDTIASIRHELPYLESLVMVNQVTEGQFESCRTDPEDPARILVSSGSEAEPKMVAYSHNAVLGGRGAYVDAVLDTGGDEPPRALVLVPLASSFGSLGLVALVSSGATVQLLGRFDAGAALDAVTALRPTHLVGVPTMLKRMADHPALPAADLSSLRALVSSGAMLGPAARAAVLARFDRPLVNVYGSTDGVNCRTVWTRASAGPDGAEGSADVRIVGRPDPRVTDLRVCDPDDRERPRGESGEIQARGPMSPLCYVGDPESDRRYRTADGWVRTGDRGVIGPDGGLRVLDRLKQVVIRGGRTISPAEVERHVEAHPVITEAVCVPVPDPDLGERLCACVVQESGTEPLTVGQLGDFLTGARGLERHKLPELLLQLDSLPLGPTGKVCRRTATALADRG